MASTEIHLVFVRPAEWTHFRVESFVYKTENIKLSKEQLKTYVLEFICWQRAQLTCSGIQKGFSLQPRRGAFTWSV